MNIAGDNTVPLNARTRTLRCKKSAAYSLYNYEMRRRFTSSLLSNAGKKGGSHFSKIIKAETFCISFTASTLGVCFAATWVGGGFIVSSVEAVYNPTRGLLWAFAPISSVLNLILGK